MTVIASPNWNSASAVPKAQQNRLTETVSQHLRESGYPALGRIACTCSAGVARLTGHVPTYYLKQVAQTVVLKADGVEQVYNFLEVEPLNEWRSVK